MEDTRRKNETKAPDDTEALIAQLGLGKKRKRLNKKKLLILAAAILLVTIAAVLLLFLPENSSDSAPAYREYTVTSGDLIVGQTESSSISLLREVVEFPVTATVEEIDVKAGSSVKEGDPLMRLNLSQIEEGLNSYELQLQMAGLELEQAKLQQETKLLAASQKLESSKQGGELADDTEDLSVGQLSNTYEAAKLTLQQAQEDYDEYCLLNEDFGNDNSTLQNYEDMVDFYQSQYDTVNSAQSTYKNYSSLISTAQKEYAATSDGNLLTKISQYESAQKQILTRYGSETALQEALTSVDAQLDAAEDRYSDYYTAFKEKYGSITEAQELIRKLASAEQSLYSADLSLEKARLGSLTGELSAEQTAATAKITADTAATNYELSEMELTQAVDAAQETYNEFNKQVEDAKSLIGDGGVVYAPTTGMVAAINVAVGDEVTVEVDEDTHRIKSYATLLTMTCIEDVYVPITISEEDILSVSIGQDALVTMTAFPDRSFEAEVDSITVSASRAGAATVTYAVNVVFKEKNELNIFEGMSAEVTLLQKAVMGVLYVNNAAITNTDGVSTVLVKDAEGNETQKVVKTGFTDGENVEIISGLSEGDVVLAESALGRSASLGEKQTQQAPSGQSGLMTDAPAIR